MTKLFCRCLSLVALSILSTGALNAQTYNEVGDAANNVPFAQATGATSGAGLTAISGNILNLLDADFFYITITNPATFSATTVGGSALDTVLYLFTANGTPVYLNDDDSGGLSVQSTLPAGHASGPLSIGTYIIGISINGVEPVNAGNQLLFADATFSTDIRGPRPGALGPVTGTNGASYTGNETGPYTIMLTGAATSNVPEPSTLALLASAGLGGLVLLRRRFRRA